MADVQAKVRAWLHTQRDWLQEAAERLLQQGALDDDAIGELCERLKSPGGQEVTTHREFNGLQSPVDSSATLRLVSIGEVQGIENLSPGRPLAFGKGNLTVVYGSTGSGKSSYTRILKKVCGKPRAQDIRPNVFQPPPDVRRCTIAYSVDGDERSATWLANGADLDELRPVDIFDGDVAGFYLSDETEVSYMPPLVALFEALAGVCERAGRKLQQEQGQLVKRLPELPPEFMETPAGNAYRVLTPGMSEAALKPIVEWSGGDQKLLEQLSERLSLNANDPAALAKQKRSRSRQITEVHTSISSAAAFVSEESCKRLQELSRLARKKRRQAIEAATVNTSSAKLDGIGTDTWIALWAAARAYSIQRAYPRRDFPVTEVDARCVLCHQTLDTEAKGRLTDFEAIVQGEMELEAKQAEGEHRRSMESLPRSPSMQELQTSCQAAGLEDEWLERISNFWTDLGQVCGRCTTADPNEDIQGLHSPSELAAALKGLSETLEADASQHDADAMAFDRAKATKQKMELEAKGWTAQQASAIRTEVDRLGQLSDFEDWRKLTNSRNVSIKAGDISEEVITHAYVARFNEELKALGASRIKVELVKTRTERGKAKHRIQLRGVTVGNHGPSSILSDGERRVVALSAFLADITGKLQTAPLAFDDPISSLDHDFEWEVAARLATLSKDRQVIVLTHRLSLYGAMEDAAKKYGEDWKRENLLQLCIEAIGGVVGHPVDEAFWNANPKKGNNILIDRLNNAKKFWDAEDSVNYKLHAQGICTDFRKLLERTVEEDLLNHIVKRHRRTVTTDNRLIQLPKITREDCEFIDGLMTKYSCFEHSQSHETPAFLPNEPELRQDLEELKAWREAFKKRPVEASP